MTHRESRLFILVRHAESFANVKGVVSSDPTSPVGLTPLGRAQARKLGTQLANLEVDLAVCSRLLRTQQTVELALQARPIPVLIEEDFDELRAGDFDEQPIENYWSWERQHTEGVRLPHGEALGEALLRYAAGLRRLLSRTEPVTLLVLHELALHHITTAATMAEPLSSIPSFANALPYLFDEGAIERAVTEIDRSIRSLSANNGAWGLPFGPNSDLSGSQSALDVQGSDVRSTSAGDRVGE